MLVDDNDPGEQVSILLFLEHSIQDARVDRAGNRRIVSRRMQFVRVDHDGSASGAGWAPYLDHRPLTEDESKLFSEPPSTGWARSELENTAQEYAAIHLVPEHLGEVRQRKESVIDKTLAAVKDRLTKEISYWDHRAAQLKDQELAGRTNAKLNSGLARQRADDLTTRLQKRLAELEQERKLAPLPPVVLGGASHHTGGIVRAARLRGADTPPTSFAMETERSEGLAMESCYARRARSWLCPGDVSDQHLGYDIESSIPNTGMLRFIEVKGRIKGSRTVTVTKNEILTGLNRPDSFILALVMLDDAKAGVHYVRRAFVNEPDFTVTSVNFDLAKLMENAQAPS